MVAMCKGHDGIAMFHHSQGGERYRDPALQKWAWRGNALAQNKVESEHTKLHLVRRTEIRLSFGHFREEGGG